MFRSRPLTRHLPFVALVAVLGVTTTASADVISDAEVVCEGAAEGKACEADGVAGTCKPSKCGRLDYSGGSPPKSVEYDCMVCAPGGAPAPTPEAAPQPDATPANADAKAPAQPAPAQPAPAQPAPAGSGCSTGGTSGDPWLLLGLAVALGRVRRRR